MLGLPFSEIWALDFEFVAESGAVPVPVCMVARELISGRLIRLWQDELGPSRRSRSTTTRCSSPTSRPPSRLLPRAGLAGADADPRPVRRVPQRHERASRCRAAAACSSALSYHGISAITAEQKTDERALVMRGGPWSTAERRAHPRLLPDRRRPAGRAAGADAARHPGPPQRVSGRRCSAAGTWRRWPGWNAPACRSTSRRCDRLRAHWDDIKLDLIAAIDKDFGVYEGTTFKAGLFAGYLADNRHRLAADRDRAACSSTRTPSATWPSATRSWSR